jgi:5-methylcytosine-specific restriction enzyme subunit McrC
MVRLKNDPIRVFEYSSITYKEGKCYNSRFTKPIYNAFESFFQANPQTSYFELFPYGIRFKQYVGVIQVGKTLIEVLPKAGKEGDAECWQRVLLDMLKSCSLLTAKKTGEAQLRLKSNSILDLYFELLLDEIELLLHKGLIKKYKSNQGQQNTLRGALVFSQHLSRNTVHQERFYTKHTIYVKEHLLHQLLYEALLLVKKLSSSSYLNDKIGRVLLSFPEQRRLTISESHFSKLTLSRKSQPYKKALDIAKLLLLNYRPDLSGGSQNLIALMFDMNVLWEEYVFQALCRDKSVTKHWLVNGQSSKSLWETKKIRPDIFLQSKTDGTSFIIDTKWKVIGSTSPADNDLKQMYVYNHYWKTTRSLLLYPKSHQTQKDNIGDYSLAYEGKTLQCILGFANVIDEKGLRGDISNQIMQKII